VANKRGSGLRRGKKSLRRKRGASFDPSGKSGFGEMTSSNGWSPRGVLTTLERGGLSGLACRSGQLDRKPARPEIGADAATADYVGSTHFPDRDLAARVL